MAMETTEHPPEQNLTLERLKSLYELIARMNSEANAQTLLELVVDRVLNLTGGRRGFLLLSDEPETDQFHHVAVVRGEGVTQPSLDAVLAFASNTVIKDVLAKGEPRMVLDLPTDQRYERIASDATLQFKRVRSVMAVPLKTAQKLIGLIYIDHPQRASFEQADLDFLSAFAGQAALAINRAREHQRRIDDLMRLNALSQSVVQVLDLDEVLARIINEANRMLNVESGSVLLLDEQEETLGFAISVANHQRVEISGRLRKEQGIAGWVVAHRQPVCINDVAADPRWFGEVEKGFVTRSLLCVPLLHNDKVLGVVQALNKKSPYGFTPADIALLSSFAASATIAIANARLFEEALQARRLRALHEQVQAQAVHLTYLNEIGGALTRSLELGNVLKVIIEGVNALLKTERTSVFLIDDATHELVLRYTNQGDCDIRLPAPWQGIAGWVALHDQPCLVNDTLSDPRHLRRVAIETGYEAHSILCVPIKIENRVIGVVEVLNKTDDQQFTHQHQALLIEFTKWAAIALHNARLFEERGLAYQRLAAEQDRRVAAETRGAMAALVLNMAHTMNNVIGAIRVWAAKLEYTAQTRPQVTLAQAVKEISHIKKNAEEAIQLIGDITDPLELPTISPTDLHYCLGEAIRSCWWPDNVKLKQNYGQNLPKVQANAKRLEAVFHNLLSNSIQAMTQTGGEIRLTTRATSNGQVEIAVADNGPGIPPELQERIFKPAVSGREGGMGLGLWLVETFIHQFNGDISFTSSPQNGATFTVTLPAEKQN